MPRVARFVALALLVLPLIGPLAPGRVAHASGGKALATLSVLAAPVMVGSLTGSGLASDGQIVELGDQVWTGPDGFALLTFFDGSETQLQGGTQIILEAPAGNGVSVFVSAGTTVTHVQHLAPQTTFQTDTPSAVAMVRGTTYVVSVETLEMASQADDDPTDAGAPASVDGAGGAGAAAGGVPAVDGASAPGAAAMAESSVDGSSTDDQEAAALDSAPLAIPSSIEPPVGCRRDNPAGCVTSIVLLADVDGRVGHVEVAPHVGTSPTVHLTSDGAAAHVTQAGAVPQNVSPKQIDKLHQAAGNPRDVARAVEAQHAARRGLHRGLHGGGKMPPPPPPPPVPPLPPLHGAPGTAVPPSPPPPTNGMAANGAPPNGTRPNTMPPSGAPNNPTPPNTPPPGGPPTNPTLPNPPPAGAPPTNGVPPNSAPSNGVPPIGAPSNGVPPVGAPSNVPPPPASPANGPVPTPPPPGAPPTNAAPTSSAPSTASPGTLTRPHP